MQVNESDDEADLQYLLSLADDEESDDEIDVLLLPFLLRNVHQRNSALFRKRWDSSYLVNPAVNKGSFISESRLDPGEFDLLHQLLSSSLERDVSQSNRSVSRSGSAPITSASRLGAALIMLGEGCGSSGSKVPILPDSTTVHYSPYTTVCCIVVATYSHHVEVNPSF